MKALCLIWFASVLLFPGMFIGQQIEIAIQKGHSAEIQFITFNSTGRLLASGGADNLIKLWHVPTGKEMVSLVSASPQPVKSMAFSSGDDFLYILYADGAVHTWDVATSSLKSTEKPGLEINFPDQRKQVSGNGEFEFKVDRFYLIKNRVKNNSRVFARVPLDISKNFTSLALSEKNSLFLRLRHEQREIACRPGFAL